MATKAFQKIYTKITQITKATCSLKDPWHLLLLLRRGKLPRRRYEDHQVQHDRGRRAGEDRREDHRGQSSEQKRPV